MPRQIQDWDTDEDGVIQSGAFKGSHTAPPSVYGGRREIVWHRPVESTVNERGDEVHPAFGMISASRVTSTPGAVLFDSDIRHGHYVTITLSTATRNRDLKHDWIHPGKQIVEVAMSEAQWASFVSSMNTSGVSCTIRSLPDNHNVDGVVYEPRLGISMAEVKDAAEKVRERLEAAVAAVEEKPTKANIRALRLALGGIEPNITFAAESLNKHTENVVQKARADIDAMVTQHAVRLGVDPQALAFSLTGSEGPLALEAGEDEEIDDNTGDVPDWVET